MISWTLSKLFPPRLIPVPEFRERVHYTNGIEPEVIESGIVSVRRKEYRDGIAHHFAEQERMKSQLSSLLCEST